MNVVVKFIALALIQTCSGWFSMPSTTARPRPTIPKNAKIIILPGFGNDSSDYFLEQAPQGSLVSSLAKRGWDPENQIRVLPVERSDWLQVFINGLFDLKFWQGSMKPTRPSFRWYLKRISDAIDELTSVGNTKETEDEPKVILICHSAGGWLARAALGFGSAGDEENGFSSCIDLSKVCGVVTLGAPHLPPPPEVMDMTRGALKLTNEFFPGAHHDELFYITVIGDAIKGVKQKKQSPFEPTSPIGFAYNSYEAVCGDGEAVGDGVVPVSAAHLDGAVQLNLDGIFHSINVPDRWYGSDEVIDQWHDEMLSQLNKRFKADGPKSQPSKSNPFEGLFKSVSQ